MCTKELIKYLTIAFCLLPSLYVKADVKDIINSVSAISTCHLEHEHNQLVTNIYQYEFTENSKDGKQVIVIDAGHGGHDPGTHGKHSKEKDIALQIALKLGKTLRSQSKDIKVIFTREKDVFIPLYERIGLANKKNADLFISIHCNYVGNPKVCGTETFVMGLHKAEENLNVAKRENSSVLLESEYETHYEGYDPNSPVGHILLSMIQNVFLDNSIDVASKIENELIARKKTKSRGVKQAGFVVLKRATMPSILVETGFLSNPKEEQYLLSEHGQKEMASGISNGVMAFFGKKYITTEIAQNTKKDSKIIPIKNPPKNTSDNKYLVQIGVFSKKKDSKFEEALKGYGTLIIQHVGSVHKYSVGYFKTREDASAIKKSLSEGGYGDGFVKTR
ncbi:MAG: N-acetylmuramoyl-L-alanine amidase [Saprospiraceae bacterium]|jgi:N-acetylmuramoyl-L-alanine amidase